MFQAMCSNVLNTVLSTWCGFKCTTLYKWRSGAVANRRLDLPKKLLYSGKASRRNYKK
jgi:hypothetical protein